MNRRKAFSLIEIMVVIVIMLLGLSIVSVKIRNGSPSVLFDNQVRNFQRFLQKTRIRAVEKGRDFQLVYDENERMFSVLSVQDIPAGNSSWSSDQEPLNEWCAPNELMARVRTWEYTELAEEQNGTNQAQLEWKLPEGMSFLYEDDGEAFTFRFRADGSGGGAADFKLTSGDYQAEFRISPVTGLVQRIIEEEKK